MTVDTQCVVFYLLKKKVWIYLHQKPPLYYRQIPLRIMYHVKPFLRLENMV